MLPPGGRQPELQRIETTEQAIRRLIDRLGGPEGLAVCYEAGPGGFTLWRLLTRLGVACDVVAPSLVAGARRRPRQDRPPRREEARRAATARAAALRARRRRPSPRAARPDALPRRPALRAHRGPPPGRSSSCCATAGSTARARRRWTQAPPRVGRSPAPGRRARAARAGADAHPPGRASSASSPRSTTQLEQIAASDPLGRARSRC